nr:metal ABC transporter permease [Planctomycetota bacterium]
SEALAKLGRIDRNAALAVVFTTAFAAGLLLLRWQADAVHIDPDHVLFGEVELSVLDTIPGTAIPRPLALAGVALVINLAFVAICFKELRVASFDPDFAEAIGINTGRLHLVQVALTAVTLVAAFESVGSILAIAMLVLPAAAARFLSHRLVETLCWSIGLALLAAMIGHALSFTVPAVLFGALGFENVEDAGTAGTMAAVGGAFFLAALLFGPEGGLLMTQGRRARRPEIESSQPLGVPSRA